MLEAFYTFFRSGSIIALAWIKNDGIGRHVLDESNSADILCRGCSVKQLLVDRKQVNMVNCTTGSRTNKIGKEESFFLEKYRTRYLPNHHYFSYCDTLLLSRKQSQV